MAAIDQRESRLIKPPGSLGRLEDLTKWYGGWRGTKLNRRHIIVFAGNHGVVAQGVTLWPSNVTAAMVEAARRGCAAINQLATSVDATLDVVPVHALRSTADMTSAPAMTEEAFLSALDAGFQAVSPRCDLLVFGEMGIGNTTVAAALSAAMFGGDVASWIGRGAGVDDAGLSRKIDAVRRALDLHLPHIKTPLDCACRLGGHEMAAILGATLAARQYRIPVILDGYVVTSAVAPLHQLNPGALDHCRLGHVSAEPGHQRLAEALNLEPLLNLGLRLGEGSGAALAIPLLRAALACHTGMATFDEIGIKDESM
ncbi:nicotinate-nucleotide--dimethylbenzimidazole phosphoribosyltransferase [Candidatus Kirkpatrickella diaphorinae]|uniref:Nicotinate-nucleotide--dimethylbenzimidazole phosphoribosyltransferase n=2 Tax=Candidatus Kirkpatrickella diaphorinae TaxID=2984322 RepID=A0ABY6GGV3_9PROT|nr:nicotinate-nucleotide--dimethylbenzimidazole phosphoribosyltransferase [Candidatus Kirkpatrickella diaphorinae]UYH50732.1 nicotinate-nucleotide--dimethylbenzimidazole phosphoribosyltransferase [Candidatus Kirkpatrickella diaphorinae]